MTIDDVLAEVPVGPYRLHDLVRPGRVRGRVYVDDDVFEAEMERIFHRTWVYVGHDTELAEPGAYKTTTIGRQPVIVTRSTEDGSIHVLFNRCRHRAATVCEGASGTTKLFRCPYHGWAYRNDGRLVAVPYQQNYGGLDKSRLGLAPVARVDSYRGFIFASIAPEGPSLLEHLGNAAELLDVAADLDIELRAGVHRYVYDGNWKLQLENSGDNYHAGVLHKSFFEVLERRTGTRIDISGPPGWRTLDLGNGHGAIDFRDGELGADLSTLPFNLVVFPNLAVLGTQVRTIRPITTGSTLVEMHPLQSRTSSPADNERRLRQHEDFYGPAGLGGPDDIVVAMERVMEGLRADQGDDWLYLLRGLDTGVTDPVTGVRAGHVTDELPSQAIYAEWVRAMAQVAPLGAAPEGEPWV